MGLGPIKNSKNNKIKITISKFGITNNDTILKIRKTFNRNKINMNNYLNTRQKLNMTEQLKYENNI